MKRTKKMKLNKEGNKREQKKVINIEDKEDIIYK